MQKARKRNIRFARGMGMGTSNSAGKINKIDTRPIILPEVAIANPSDSSAIVRALGRRSCTATARNAKANPAIKAVSSLR